MIPVVTVLRRGRGKYRRQHVYRIKRALNRYLPEHRFVCLSDRSLQPEHWWIPLEHGWPHWWSKLETCRPGLVDGPLLYTDLDMAFVGGVEDMVEDVSTSIVLRDLYRGRRDRRAVQSALMLLTEEDRARVWERWMSGKGPQHWIRTYSGDQQFFELVLKKRARFWQNTHPGRVVGYKTDLRHGRVPPSPDASVVVFHGKPRPWEVTHPWARGPELCT